LSGKKSGEKDVEKPSIMESDLYNKVENFFAEEKKCEKTGSTISLPLSLRMFGGTVYPDVFGVTDPKSKDFQIYMAEGKLSFRGRDFDICKGQAITLQRFADYVYVFFPKSSWDELDKDEKSEVLSECGNLKLGLLIVEKDACKEVVKAYPNSDLLKEENRTVVRDEMVQYFPDFIGPQENIAFFESYTKLADSIVKKSYELVERYLTGSFTKITPIKRQSIRPWCYGDTFEFYLISQLENSEVQLILQPFGSEIFDTNSPTLLIQEKIKGSIVKKQNIRQKLAKYVNERLKEKCRIDTGDFIFFDPEPAESVLSHIEDIKPEDFSVFEQIKIQGMEMENIRENVEKSLQRIVDFSNSLK